MNTGKTVFSQVIDFLPMHEFRKCVQRYEGNYKAKNLSCFDQSLCMAFAQLTYRESLRDIETCLRSMQEKLYHREFVGKFLAVPWLTQMRTENGVFIVNEINKFRYNPLLLRVDIQSRPTY